MSSETQVVHKPSEHRHEIAVEGRAAVLEYEDRDGARHFTHTFVPPELRGRGLAELLVKAGLAEARSAGLRIVADCSYVAAYLKRNP